MLGVRRYEVTVDVVNRVGSADWVLEVLASAAFGGPEHAVDAVNTTLAAYEVVPGVAVQVAAAQGDS